jgi:hypothetical protein
MWRRIVRAARLGVAAGLVGVSSSAPASAQVAAPAPETIAIGDWQLAPLAELRVRGEYARDLDDRDRGALVERARLGVEAERGPVEGRVVFQDARLLAIGAGREAAWRLPPFSRTGAYEAWAEAHTAAARPMFVRVGRQPVTWGEGRLLGVADWSPAPRSLDAVRARMPWGDAAVELLGAILSDPAGALLTAYGELLAARGQWALQPLFAIEASVLARLAQGTLPSGVEASVAGQTYTGTLRLHGDGYGWTWGVEGAYQLGRAQAARGGADRAAWAAAGHVGRMFERIFWIPTVRLGLSYASGDDGSSTYRAFDPLLPDVHLWHGALDVFGWSNEEEANARVAIAPWTDATAAVEYRYARLAQPGGAWLTAYLVRVGQAPGNTHADLGHEIDAVLRWSPCTPIDLTAGYSALVLGDGARAILQTASVAPPALSHFAYAQASLSIP